VELYAKKGQVAKQVGGKGELCPSQFKGGHQPSQDEAQLYREKEERLRERPPPSDSSRRGTGSSLASRTR
jgi:hydroxymethylpyrimidine/phosphomethylpyrimidine kinase